MPVKKELHSRLVKNKTRRFKKAVLQLRSFGLVNQSGKLSFHKPPLTESVNNAQNNKTGKFLNWCMPEEETGYIKCKEHDFL